jgi:hypothetical protein
MPSDYVRRKEESYTSRRTKVTGCRGDMRGAVLGVAHKCCDGAEEKWQMANMHRFHESEQGLPEG